MGTILFDSDNDSRPAWHATPDLAWQWNVTWQDEWEIVLPRTLTFEGKEFRRADLERHYNDQNLTCEYRCPRFFERRTLPGMYVTVVVRPSEPATKDLIMHKLEVLGTSMREIARREHERTEMLELDGLVNGDLA